MEKRGHIEIRVTGRKGNLPITPENYDIKDVISVLGQVEKLLFPTSRKGRPLINYEIREGSVRHIIGTSMQVIIGFNAIISQINHSDYSIDFLERETANALKEFRESARKQDISFEISTSVEGSPTLIVDRNTNFRESEEIWVDSEFYFFGIVTDIGGKSSANVHLDTQEFGLLKIEAAKEQLSAYKANPLYKKYGVRATGRQESGSGDIDKSSLQLIDIIDYDPTFDEDYLNRLISSASKSWEGISDADEWLSQIRS